VGYTFLFAEGAEDAEGYEYRVSKEVVSDLRRIL
jgi:hypothetical protein